MERDGSLGQDVAPPLVHSAKAIGAHPQFRAAQAIYYARFDALYGDNPFLNKLMMQGARSLVFITLLLQDAAYDEADRATWPTLASLQRAMAQLGLGSSRHVEQLIQRLIHVGFVEARASPADRRVRLLKPAAPMIAHDLDWIAAHYAPLAYLYGAERYALPLTRDRAFQAAQRRVAAASLEALSRPLLTNPPILFFAQHDAAFMILLALAKAALEVDAQVAVVPYAELARRYAISRTHVRRVLDQAAERGWIVLEGGPRRAVALLSPLRAALDRFVAESMANHDLTLAQAMRDLATGPVGRT